MKLPRLSRTWRRLNLWPRLVIVVTGGFLALFFVFGFLAIRAIEGSTERIQAERLVIAEMVARDIDRVLDRGFSELERAGRGALFEPSAPPFRDEAHMLDHVHASGLFPRGALFLDTRGHVVLTRSPARPTPHPP